MDAGGPPLKWLAMHTMTTNQQPKKSKDLTGTMIAIGLVVLIPSALFFYLRSSGLDISEIKEEMKKEVQADPSPAKQTKPAPRARVVRESDLRREDSQRNRVRIPERAEAAPPPQTLARSKAFPTPSVVHAGMRKSELIASFGKPNMITTSVDEGRATETFVYLQRGTDTGTVVCLQGGSVVSTTTAAY